MITGSTPYRKYVDTCDVTEQEKLELVNAVWVILENYFDHQLILQQSQTEELVSHDAGAELEPGNSGLPEVREEIVEKGNF